MHIYILPLLLYLLKYTIKNCLAIVIGTYKNCDDWYNIKHHMSCITQLLFVVHSRTVCYVNIIKWLVIGGMMWLVNVTMYITLYTHTEHSYIHTGDT